MRRRQFLPLAAGLAAAPLDPPGRLRLARSADQAGGAVHAGHRSRHHRPLRGRAAVAQARPARGGGECRRAPAGNIGSQQVARAKPDGHTLMSSVNTLVMNASLYKNLPYDPVADFAPLGLTAWGSLVLVAHPGQKPNTLGELVAAAKADAQDADLRQPGRRHAASSFDGAGRDRIGHRAGARALQGHGGRGAGPFGRPDRLHVPARPCLRPAHPRRQAEGDRRRQSRAPAAASRRADARRKRPEGRRCRHVVRLLRPQGHASRDRRAAEQGGRGDPRFARSQDRVRGAGTDPRHLDAGRAGRDRGARPHALGRCRGQARDSRPE